MIMQYDNGTILYANLVDGSYIIQSIDGNMIKIMSDGLYMVDKYGNTTFLTDINFAYKQNSPSYDELYEYWLKTKEGVNDENTKN